MQRRLILLFSIITPYLFIGNAYGQNITGFNQSLAQLDPYLEHDETVNIFFPIFLMVTLCMFMILAFRMMMQQWAFIFSLGATILCIVLSLMFLSPLEFDFNTINTVITIEEVNWLTGETTTNYQLVKTSNQNIIIPNDHQFRMIMTEFFSVLSLFNGLFAILIVTNVFKKK